MRERLLQIFKRAITVRTPVPVNAQVEFNFLEPRLLLSGSIFTDTESHREIGNTVDQVSILATTISLPGDANLNGVVDIADLGILSTNFNGTKARWFRGNFNADVIVDVADLGIIGANWTAATNTTAGFTTSPGSTAELALDEENSFLVDLGQAIIGYQKLENGGSEGAVVSGLSNLIAHGFDANDETALKLNAIFLLELTDIKHGVNGSLFAGEFATASISLKEYGNFDNLLDVGRDSFQDLKQDLIDDLLDHGFTAQSIMSQGNNNHTPYANELVHGGIDISDVILAGMKLGHEGQTVSTLIASGISELNILSAQGADFAPTIMINGGIAHKILAASQLLGVEGEVIKNFEEHNISWRMLLVPGDANYDGTVDVEDLGILGANFKKLAAQWSLGNFNVDLVVDVADLGIIGANWTSD